jgi:hypothetical protein
VIIIILLVLEIAVVLGYRRKKEATVKVE